MILMKLAYDSNKLFIFVISLIKFFVNNFTYLYFSSSINQHFEHSLDSIVILKQICNKNDRNHRTLCHLII